MCYRKLAYPFYAIVYSFTSPMCHYRQICMLTVAEPIGITPAQVRESTLEGSSIFQTV
jgi:hypothetical protein